MIKKITIIIIKKIYFIKKEVNLNLKKVNFDRK